MSKVLYKIDNKDKVRVWKAWSVGADVIVEHGIFEGKLQQSVYTATEKNVGKVNYLSAECQAMVEVVALYEDQQNNHHYRDSIEKAQAVKSDNLIPRKILNYKDGWKKLPDQCITSVKLNGSRACIINGQLYSKIGRPEDVNDKLISQGIKLARSHGFGNLDCEVYAHGIPLQRIRSAWLKPYKTDKEICEVANKRFNLKGGDRIKQVEKAIQRLGYNPNQDARKLKLYVFDIPCTINRGYTERLGEIERFKKLLQSTPLLQSVFDLCEYFYTNSHEERMEKLDEVHKQGYEGLVHYDPSGIYEFGKRSSNTQKAKPRLDGEALVVGVEKCKNGEGKLLLRCNDQMDNVEFKAMMKGSREERDYSVQQQFIGQWVTFEYEELSEKNLPLKPVALNKRLCDDNGNVIE